MNLKEWIFGNLHDWCKGYVHPDPDEYINGLEQHMKEWIYDMYPTSTQTLEEVLRYMKNGEEK